MEDQSKKSLMNFREVSYYLGKLEGEALTIVDASFSDVEQRKAVKDLIKGCFFRNINRMAESLTGVAGARYEGLDQHGEPNFSFPAKVDSEPVKK